MALKLCRMTRLCAHEWQHCRRFNHFIVLFSKYDPTSDTDHDFDDEIKRLRPVRHPLMIRSFYFHFFRISEYTRVTVL